jgi:predicted GNAT family acetyltransferase
MHIQRFDDLNAFLARVDDFFTKAAVHHAPILKVLTSLEKNLNQYGPESPWFFCITDEAQDIVGAGIQTPPQPLVITEMPNSAVCLLVEYLKQQQIEIIGLRGPIGPARLFTALWQGEHEDPLDPVVELKLYSLDQVTHEPRTTGKLIQAGTDDLDLVHSWVGAFSEEVSLPAGGPSKERIASRVEQGEYFFWEVDGVFTCVLAKNAKPQHGVSHIGPVYTPPKYRGFGYATDASAILSQFILNEGARYSSLFADLHNPHTNKIYQMIGYEEVSVHNVFYFEN